MHIHLDPLGGIAGDMFAAAMLDAFPHLEAAVQKAVRAASLPARFRCDLVKHADHALTGRRFLVLEARAGDGGHGHAHPHHPHSHSHPHAPAHDHAHAHGHPHGPSHDHDHGHVHEHAHGHPHAPAHDHASTHSHDHARDHEHGHRPFASIRADIQGSALDEGIRAHAIAIFSGLAEAEAQVHGSTVDTVTFHEVGEWDSIADVVAAATIIHALSPATWSCGPLPLGSGFVNSAHGILPVPAPATSLLLRGLSVRDDGIPGERVTPTGAAIVRHLMSIGGTPPRTRVMVGTGFGFGTKVLPGISNCVRALVFGDEAAKDDESRLTEIEFEVDDQTPEDLALGIDHLRAHPQVVDVSQTATFGKKGRLAVSVRVLCRREAEDEVAGLCFSETTTLGLRLLDVRRRTLPRTLDDVNALGRKVARKKAARGSEITVKAEAESLRDVRGHSQRQKLRVKAESE